MHDIIITARTKDGKRVRIEDAERRGRYLGYSHHAKCDLYPVFRRKGRRSSFAHLPDMRHCLPPTGESSAHREVKMRWFRFFEDQLSGCIVCTTLGRDSQHLYCPTHTDPLTQSEPSSPLHGEVVWTCAECLKPHFFDLLKNARSVECEAWQFGRSCRPDITILEERDKPVAFVEFVKSNPPGKVHDVAKGKGIPLFEIPVNDDESFTGGLYNPDRRLYDNFDWISDKDKEMMRRLDSGQLSGNHASVEPYFDNEGNLLDVTFHYSDDGSVPTTVPNPRLGPYLYAEKSTLDCTSQTEEFFSRA